MPNLYDVEYYRIVKVRVSNEFVWAESEQEAKDFGNRHVSPGLEVRVKHVYAAATTEDKPTPPGLDTYKVEQGIKL